VLVCMVGRCYKTGVKERELAMVVRMVNSRRKPATCDVVVWHNDNIVVTTMTSEETDWLDSLCIGRTDSDRETGIIAWLCERCERNDQLYICGWVSKSNQKGRERESVCVCGMEVE